MISRHIKVSQKEGLQSRSAELLVRVAGRYASSINIELGNKRVNAKSIMGVLSLRLRRGDSFLVVVDGADEDAAMDAIHKLVEKGEADI